MTHRYRQLVATAVAAGCALCIAACGSSSSSKAPAAGAGGRAQPAAFRLTTTQRACLKRHGVTLSAAGARGGRPAGHFGGPGKAGTPPTGAHRRSGPGFGGAQSTKMRTALSACGVSFGRRPGGGAPPSTTTSRGS